MGYNGQGLDKRSQGIITPIVVEVRVNHEGLGFGGTNEKAIATKITFVKAKDVVDLGCL